MALGGGDSHGQRAREPERSGGDERPETYPGGLTSETGDRDPRVSRPVPGVARVDAEVVVGAKERVKSALLRRERQLKDLLVARAVTRLEQYGQLGHAALSPSGTG
jgi:hypothetical protein